MENHQTTSLPSELSEIAGQLKAERPTLSKMELARAADRLGIGARSTSQHRNRKAEFLKTRLATVLVLSVGVLFGGSGLAMGVTALQSTDNASESEYGACRATSESDACNGVLGESDSGDPGEGSGDDDRADTQAVSQKATASADLGTLPFTGYLAVPALILGLVFIGSGLVLRRAVREE